MSESERVRAAAGAEGGFREFAILDAGPYRVAPWEFPAAIRSILAGQVSEFARDRNSTCYRIRLSGDNGAPETAIVKVPRLGPQRTNADASFAGEAAILARLPDAGLFDAPKLLARVAAAGGYFLFTTHLPGAHPDPRLQPFDSRQLYSILDSLFMMDRQGLMHYDLKPANILLDEDRAAFVDFEFARFEDPGNSYAPANGVYCEDFNVSGNPYFPAKSNVVNFEFRTLYRYLVDLGEEHSPATVDTLFREYLETKSRYHGRMADCFYETADTAAAAIAMAGGIAVTEVRRRLTAARAHENMLAALFKGSNDLVVRMERSLMAFRCHIFECRRDQAHALWRQARTTLAHEGTGADTMPWEYRRAAARIFDLVWRSRPVDTSSLTLLEPVEV